MALVKGKPIRTARTHLCPTNLTEQQGTYGLNPRALASICFFVPWKTKKQKKQKHISVDDRFPLKPPRGKIKHILKQIEARFFFPQVGFRPRLCRSSSRRADGAPSVASAMCLAVSRSGAVTIRRRVCTSGEAESGNRATHSWQSCWK